MAKFRHYEILKQYALLAQEHENPWEFIQGRGNYDEEWEDFSIHYLPTFNPSYLYRIKTKTININGFEVPEPLRVKPGYRVKYYYPDISIGMDGTIQDTYWQNTSLDNNLFNNGLIHLEHESAKMHAEALLSFTKTIAHSFKIKEL